MIQFLDSLLKKRIVESSRKHFSQDITRQERIRNMFRTCEFFIAFRRIN